MHLSEHRLVFVGGLHRSGTTLLARCLADHPDVSGFAETGAPQDEGQHLQRVYPPARTYGGAGVFAFDPGAHLTEESGPLHREKTAAALAGQWGPYWDTGKPVLVEKSPPNLLMMRYLQDLFPQAFFVLVMRHPMVVSLATSRWRPGLGLPALLAHWVHAHELAAADAPMIRRLHVVRYEALVSRPQETLAALGGFLGLRGEMPRGRVRGDRSRRYERQWGLRRAGPLRRLPHRDLRRLEERCARFGYRFDDLRAVRPDCMLLAGSSAPHGV